MGTVFGCLHINQYTHNSRTQRPLKTSKSYTDSASKLRMKILMLVTMFAFVMAGLPTHAEVSECTKTHAGGCANYNKLVLATFRENDFTISTCLTKCRTNTRCEGFALGKNRVTGKCILYKSDDQGNECINDGNKNWDYYSMKDCSATKPAAKVCTTVSGASPNLPCIFPFRFNGVTHNKCTWDQAHLTEHKAWCSTLVDETGHHVGGQGKWGNCGPTCPIAPEPGCKCDSRGKLYHRDGDWCYLATAPCKFLDNSLSGSDTNWSDCMNKDGKKLIDCDAPECKTDADCNSQLICKAGRCLPRKCPQGKCWCISSGGQSCVTDTRSIQKDGKWLEVVGYRAKTTSSYKQAFDASTIIDENPNAYCQVDQCLDKNVCAGSGYWCDDSHLPDHDGTELVDCSKYYKGDIRAVQMGEVYHWKDYGRILVDLNMKTFVNCVQAQLVKMKNYYEPRINSITQEVD